jgi:hypothetical protein
MTADILASSPGWRNTSNYLAETPYPLVTHQALAQRLALDQGFGLCMADQRLPPPAASPDHAFRGRAASPDSWAGRMQSSAMPAWRLIT